MVRASKFSQMVKFLVFLGIGVVFLLNMNSWFNMKPTEGAIQTMDDVSGVLNNVLKPLQGITQNGLASEGANALLGKNEPAAEPVQESVEVGSPESTGIGDWIGSVTTTVTSWLSWDRSADKEMIVEKVEVAMAELGYAFNAEEAESKLRQVVGPNALSVARTEDMRDHNTMDA